MDLEGKICGICGKYDYKLNQQEHASLDGTTIYDQTGDFVDQAFYDEYVRANDPEGCLPDGKPGPAPPDCNQTQVDEFCSIINDPNGPFKSCLRNNQQRLKWFNICKYVVCVSDSYKCGVLAMYATLCGNSGPVGDWRSLLNCEKTCRANQEFHTELTLNCLPACWAPNPCNGALVDPSQPRIEGCVCKDGFTWNGEECVAQCKTHGKVHPATIFCLTMYSKTARDNCICDHANGCQTYCKDLADFGLVMCRKYYIQTALKLAGQPGSKAKSKSSSN